MSVKALRALSLLLVSLLLLSSCSSSGKVSDRDEDALTVVAWRGYEQFWELLTETYPEITMDFTYYAGASRTGYSWTRMQADDIADIFITSQIIDESLAEERLIDLSGYPFINQLSTSILDQVSIDGGIYLLPVSMDIYGILYNKTLMEEMGWEVPENFAELEALCDEIQAEGMIPGVADARLPGGPFAAVFNLAKTSWLTTPEGMTWEQEFLAGNASAEGRWEDTMDYVQRYIDLGMFYPDPEDRKITTLLQDYLGKRRAVFCAATFAVSDTVIEGSTDELGMMPYLSEDGSKNIYMYSPSSFIGINKHLMEPGKEKKLEQALQLLALLYSPEGQEAFIHDETPCTRSILDDDTAAGNHFLDDAQQAIRDGRAFPMTYLHWETILQNIGQAYKEWFRGENGMDGPKCIARMDELLQDSLYHSDQIYFCESTADFSLEETAKLVGKALGSKAGTDAVMVPMGNVLNKNAGLASGITGKLYRGKINMGIVNTIMPSVDGEYAVMSMTGAQAKDLAAAGFDADGDGLPYPYLLVTKGEKELEDNTTYQVAFLMQGYTEEMEKMYSAQQVKGSLLTMLMEWMEEQGTISPDSNPWN